MMGLRYGLALTIACLALAAVYVLDHNASTVGRIVAASLTALSFSLPGGLWLGAPVIVLQLGLSIFVLCRLALLRQGGL